MKKRVMYLDIIKILSAILVIFNHYAYLIHRNSTVAKVLFTLMFTFCKIAVPLFIMASGALLLNKKANYKEIFSKRVVRIFIPLVIVSAVYVFVYSGGLNTSNIFSFILALFTEYDVTYIPYWIWYLYMLLALYIMTPFIQKMIENFKDKDYKMFFYVFLIGVGMINMFSAFNKVLRGEGVGINGHFTGTLFSISIAYFVWGHYISKIKLSKKHVKIAWIVLIVSFILEVLFLIFGIYYRDFNYGYDDLIDWSMLFVGTMAASVFLLAKYYIKNFKSEKLQKFIVTVSNSTFGVYLTHVFLGGYLEKISFIRYLMEINSFLGCVTMVFIAFIILTVIFYILRKVPIVKNFL